MSAFLVSDVHLSALAQHMWVKGVVQSVELDTVWQHMKHANLYALKCRYGEACPPINEIEINRSTVEARLDDVKMHGVARCYLYQCAEFNTYEQHPGPALALKLKKILEAQGVDASAPTQAWDITSWDEVIRPVSAAQERAVASGKYEGMLDD